MSDTFDVIAAFVDDERVEPEALKRALSEAEGRDYLVDLLALRAVVREHEAQVWHRAGYQPNRTARARSSLVRWVAAAVLLVAVGGTWFLTSRQADRPPTPDHVVKLERGLDWRGN